MKISFPVRYKIKELPVTGFNLRNLYQALSSNITGSVSDYLMPAGQASGLQQNADAPIFTGMGWNIWDVSLRAYRPITTKLGDVVLSANPSADRTQGIQNQDGTVALLDDVYGIRDTVVVAEGIVSVDWDESSNFTCLLNQNRKTNVFMTHSKPGMKVNLLFVNQGTSQGLLWDSVIQWPNSTAPDISPALPGQSSSLFATLRNIAGTIYGESRLQSHANISSTSFSSGGGHTTGTT